MASNSNMASCCAFLSGTGAFVDFGCAGNGGRAIKAQKKTAATPMGERLRFMGEFSTKGKGAARHYIILLLLFRPLGQPHGRVVPVFAEIVACVIDEIARIRNIGEHDLRIEQL